MNKTTITGWSVPQVEAVGTLAIQTNHPRGFIVVDTVKGTAQRGRRNVFALRGEDGFRKEDAAALLQVAQRIAKAHGISVTPAPAPKPLPTTINVPGNGVVSISSLGLEALRFAYAFEKNRIGADAQILEALRRRASSYYGATLA